LGELIVGQKDSGGGGFSGGFKADGDPAVKVGAGQSNPAVCSAFDLDGAEDSQGGSCVDDLAKASESGFKFRDGECDGFHSVVGGVKAKSPCTR